MGRRSHPGVFGMASLIFSGMAHFVYILYAEQHDKYYIGQTDDLEMRLQRHNEFEASQSYTSKYRPWALKIFFKAETRSDAVKIERKLKALKSKKMIAFFADDTEALSKFALNTIHPSGV
jgi:putative endonuclease